MLVCLNGTFIPQEDARISITDGGFLFGDTLFETLKAKDKRILLRAEHLDRLELSAKLLGLPCDRPQIEIALNQLEPAFTKPTSRIRLTISRGAFDGLSFPDKNQGQFLLTARAAEDLGEDQRSAGAACCLAPNHRTNPLDHLPQMKRGNYADCLYAANYARQKGCHEALFMDEGGQILEGSTSNIFALFGNKLVTPPLGTLILDGIMRRQTISAAIELGLSVAEQDLSISELQQADEAFLSNSLIDIMPISSLDGKSLNRGTFWITLLKTLRMRIET